MKNKIVITLAMLHSSIGCSVLMPGAVTEEVRVDRVLDKAAWDLKCGKEAIKITKINDTTYGATGCGKRAAYLMENCMSDFLVTSFASACTAVLNSEINDNN